MVFQRHAGQDAAQWGVEETHDQFVHEHSREEPSPFDHVIATTNLGMFVHSTTGFLTPSAQRTKMAKNQDNIELSSHCISCTQWLPRLKVHWYM